MKLIKVTKKGSLHFDMSDGRLGISYETGYIRVSVKGIRNRLYQINSIKRIVSTDYKGMYYYERVLIPNQADRLNALLKFETRNCK
jgi:hypothetical protein